jgi:hypothetical protein
VGDVIMLAFSYLLPDNYDWVDYGDLAQVDTQMFWLEHTCHLARSYRTVAWTKDSVRVYAGGCPGECLAVHRGLRALGDPVVF